MNNNHEISIDEKLKEAGAEFLNLFVRNISNELRNIVKEEIQNQTRLNEVEEAWIDLNEAKKILKVTSRRKWKILRDNNEIDFTRSGKIYLYFKPSLVNYLRKNSTIKKRNNFF